jgi:hypothetical protein
MTIIDETRTQSYDHAEQAGKQNRSVEGGEHANEANFGGVP